MHGLVLISFQRFAEARGLDGAPRRSYDADEAYPDEEFTRWLAEVAQGLGVDESVVQREFGEYLGREAFPELAPSFYDTHGDLLSALLAVEEQIHELVRRAVPGAAPPRLRVAPLGEHGAVIAYTSERHLCALLEGLVEGTAARYGTPIRLEHPQCMHKGDIACSIVVERM